MKRREVISKLGLGSLALALPGNLFPEKLHRKSKNYAWTIPAVGKSLDYYKKLFENAKACGIDGIILEVYNNHVAFYDTDRFPVEEDVLSKVIPICKAAGLELHTWMHTIPCNIEKIVKEHPDWYAVNGKGEASWLKPAYVPYYKFLDPCNEEAMEFVKGTVESLAKISEIDGVHFDYVRLPDVIIAPALQPKYNITQDREYPEYDYSYSIICRQQFKSLTGIDPLTDLKDPSANEAWRQFRYDSITNVVNGKLIPVVKQYGKKASAAVFPNWKAVRQEWRKWNLDFATPMLYHNFYYGDVNWIGDQTKQLIQEQQVPKTIYSGLFIPALNDAALKNAFKVSMDAGASGTALFHLAGMDDVKWKAFREVVNK